MYLLKRFSLNACDFAQIKKVKSFKSLLLSLIIVHHVTNALVFSPNSAVLRLYFTLPSLAKSNSHLTDDLSLFFGSFPSVHPFPLLYRKVLNWRLRYGAIWFLLHCIFRIFFFLDEFWRQHINDFEHQYRPTVCRSILWHDDQQCVTYGSECDGFFVSTVRFEHEHTAIWMRNSW